LGSVSPQGAANSLPAHLPIPSGPRFKVLSESGTRLKNELARIQEELMTAVFRAAKIERELEALGAPISSDALLQTDGSYCYLPFVH